MTRPTSSNLDQAQALLDPVEPPVHAVDTAGDAGVKALEVPCARLEFEQVFRVPIGDRAYLVDLGGYHAQVLEDQVGGLVGHSGMVGSGSFGVEFIDPRPETMRTLKRRPENF